MAAIASSAPRMEVQKVVLAEYLMLIHLEVPMVVHPWLWAGWAVEKGLHHRKLHRQTVMMAWCKAVCLL